MTQPALAGSGIRKLRLDKNLKQKFVADKANIPLKTFQRMEAGKTKIAIQDLGKLSETLGVPETEILKAEGIVMNNHFSNQHGHNIGYVEKIEEAPKFRAEETTQSTEVKIESFDLRLKKIEEMMEKILSKV